MKRLRVTVCRGPECGLHSGDIARALRDHIVRLGLEDHILLDQKSCYGRCRSGPNLVISEITGDRPRFVLATIPATGRSTMYNQVTPEKAVRALEAHALAVFGSGSL